MKRLYTLIFATLLTCTAANARIVTSQANGNATSPLTWDCLCIPVDGDTIMINHAIVLDVDYAFTMGGIHINTTGSVTGNQSSRIFGVSGGFFINDGSVQMGYIAHNGGSFTNNSTLTILGSLLIDQTVTFVNNGPVTIGDTAYVNTNATLQNNNTFDATSLLSAGTILNAGNLSAFTLYTTGTLTHTGVALILQESFYNTGNATLNTYTEVMGDVWNAENMTVNSYLKTQSLYNGDTISGSATFTNNGTISVANSLFNSEDINGNGDFCVVDSSLNSGAIAGTVDICDQTGGAWDINIGTEAGTVTHCAAGPCTIGIAENTAPAMSLTPNPAHEILTIEVPVATNASVTITDVTGRIVQQEYMNGTRANINVLHLPPGMYSVSLVTDNGVTASRFVKE